MEFVVEVVRKLTQTGSLHVEAASADEAQKQAEENIAADTAAIAWDEGLEYDGEDARPSVTEARPLINSDDE